MGLSKCIKNFRLERKTPDDLLVRVDDGSARPLPLAANCDEGPARDLVCMAVGCERRRKVTEVEGGQCSAVSWLVPCVVPVPKSRCVQVHRNTRSFGYGALFPLPKGTSLTVNHVQLSGADIGNVAQDTKSISVLCKQVCILTEAVQQLTNKVKSVDSTVQDLQTSVRPLAKFVSEAIESANKGQKTLEKGATQLQSQVPQHISPWGMPMMAAASWHAQSSAS